MGGLSGSLSGSHRDHLLRIRPYIRDLGLISRIPGSDGPDIGIGIPGAWAVVLVLRADHPPVDLCDELWRSIRLRDQDIPPLC